MRNHIKQRNLDIEEAILKKQTNIEFTNIKKEIKSKWLKIGVVVTPICDFVQRNNNIYDRVVKGILMPEEYKDFIDDKSEAIFICPFSINYEDINYTLALDFRYFITTDLTSEENIKATYRIRQELLAEIQSKLSRHINRQGILFLD